MADSRAKVFVVRRSIGFLGLLFIILILLKAGVIETTAMGWSWIWITAPLWGPIALIIVPLLIVGLTALICLLCYLLVQLIMYIIKRIKKNRKNK